VGIRFCGSIKAGLSLPAPAGKFADTPPFRYAKEWGNEGMGKDSI